MTAFLTHARIAAKISLTVYLASVARSGSRRVHRVSRGRGAALQRREGVAFQPLTGSPAVAVGGHREHCPLSSPWAIPSKAAARVGILQDLRGMDCEESSGQRFEGSSILSP